MLREWRSAPHSGRTCVATRARPTVRCCRGWQRKAASRHRAPTISSGSTARKGKKSSNEEWVSPTDAEAKIATMTVGTTHLTYKPEHAIDLDTGAVVAADIQPEHEGDTTTVKGALKTAEANLGLIGRVAPVKAAPSEFLADNGYHSRAVLKELDGSVSNTRIAEPQLKGILRSNGDPEACGDVYANRNRLRSGRAKAAMRRRGEIVEHSFAHLLERGGMRVTWLCGRENVRERYRIHVAGQNLGLLMRQRIGASIPK